MITSVLHNALQDIDTPLSILLSVRHISKLTILRDSSYESYFIHHAGGLLERTLSDERDPLAITAFNILIADRGQFLRPVVADGSFSNRVVELLGKGEMPVWITGRLATLTLVALTHVGALAFQECGFLYRLLAYCDHPAVDNLFETITSEDPELPLGQLQDWLREFGFCEYVIREAGHLDFMYQSTFENPYKDPVYNRAVYLYQLIARGCENTNLKVGFQTSEVVQCLSRQFAVIPDFVQIARWKAIVAVTCPATASVAVAFFSQAVGFLQHSFQVLREYRVLALSYLNKMMELDERGYDLVLNTRVAQNALNLVFQFHNSTLLHSEFLKFVEIGVRHRDLAALMVESYVPVAVDRAAHDDNRIIKATCFEMMELVIRASHKDRRLKAHLAAQIGISEFKKGPLREFERLLEMPYGGKPPGTSPFAVLTGIFAS
jgi:hypothetical protein